MKKVLFATTALVASAGIAAADVTLSGFAEMGFAGGDAIETQFHSDFDVKFSLSGETDNGLSFGATIDLDEVSGGITAGGPTGGAADTTGTNSKTPHSVWISGGWGKLTMGDTDGGFDWAMKEAIIGSSINDAHEHAGYNGNSGLDGNYGGQILRYDNSFGAFGVAASVATDDTGAGDATLGLGVKYSTDLGGASVGFGLGYQTDDIDSIVGVSVDVTTDSGISAIVNFSDLDSKGEHTGVAIGYSMDALKIGVNWGQTEVAGVTTDGIGLAVNYKLSDDVTVQLGYGSDDTEDSWSLGLAMKF